MLLETLSLGAGLVLGTKFNISNDVLLGAGLLLGAAVPFMPLSASLGILGVGVVGVVKNIIKETYIEKKEVLIQEFIQKEIEVTEEIKDEIDCRASKEASSSFWCFTSTLTFMTVPLALIGTISGLSSLLLPLSIIILVVKGWLVVTSKGWAAIKYIISGLLIAVVAFISINVASSGGVLIYFLSLITIPSIFLNKKKKTDVVIKEEKEGKRINNIKSNENKDEEKVFNLNIFLYGMSSKLNIIGTACILIQTILWGSSKDILGTIINTDLSILLDPIRFALTTGITLFLVIFGGLFLNKYIKKVSKEDNNNILNKITSKILPTILSIISIGFSLTIFNPLCVGGLIIAGFLLNLLDDNNIIKSIAIPILLIVGALSGF